MPAPVSAALARVLSLGMHRASVLRAAAADDAAAVAARLRIREQEELGAAERQARARRVRRLRQFIPATTTPARVHRLEAGTWPVHDHFRMRIDHKDVPSRDRASEAAGVRVARHTERWETVIGA